MSTPCPFKIGDEWSDGVGNYIIIAIDVTGERIVTFDFEGCVDVQSVDEWRDFIREMPLTPVTTDLAERLKSWRESGHEHFPPLYAS